MSHSSPPRRNRRRDDLEEGEIATDSGSDSPRDDDDDDMRPEIQGPRLEQQAPVVGGGQVDAPPSPTPSSEYCDSDGTVSDVVVGAQGRTPQMFPCPICWREFGSIRAVSGHMRMHEPQERQGRPRARAPAVAGGWAVRRRRGFVGSGRSASPEEEEVVDSMAIVVGEEPVMDPAPIAFGVEPDANPNVSTAIAAAAAGNPPNPNNVAVHPSCSPQFVAHNQSPVADQAVLSAHPQPAVAQGDQPAPATPPQFTAQQPSRPPPARSPPVRDEQGWWVCKQEGCDKRFHTYQGLGGHMAGHKNRQMSEAAAAGVGDAGAAAGARPARMHSCNVCGLVYDAGTKLGGHKRKHYMGKVIPRKRAATESVSAGQLAAAVSSAVQASQGSTMAMEGPELQLALPSEAPVPAASSIRIFGVTMTPHVQSQAATSSTVMEADQSSGATSTNTQ